MKIKYFLIVALALLLAGCHPHRDAVYLVNHPETFRSILNRCEQTHLGKIKQDKACHLAITVYQQVVETSREMIQHPQQFGARILKSQMEVAGLKEELSKLETSKTLLTVEQQHKMRQIKEELSRLRHDLAIKLAIIKQLMLPE